MSKNDKKNDSESPSTGRSPTGQPPESNVEQNPAVKDKPVAPPIRVIIEGEKPR